jgi:biopolymer transport protein ExbD
MAGSQDRDENPVAVNVVPMVDVIFCLCVFFMCSFKFKQESGRFDAWLPKDRGVATDVARQPQDVGIEDVRVALLFDEKTGATRRKLATRVVRDDAELQALLRDAHDEARRVAVELPLTIDSDGRVPWSDVVAVMNVAKRAGVEKIDFAYGAPTK